ncbi:MAG: hypothetical protein C0617_09435 [Desulfuromonas sp.]|uniref:EAL domain-containing protein n=1 Tax=Desulfuromonas sp. TaxID=892 RepID=UPI000CC8D902|nr:EAL domain-containing protein [Desulfuromonas sp.]PLX84034.1 MAG: hypothetical protein C0617_09435 [Desulfuromonas sp.]
MKRLLPLLFIVFFVQFSLPAHAAQAVRVGVYQNLPMVAFDEAGGARGIFPELMEEIARLEGWELEYVPGTWYECLQRAARGEIDVISSIALTEERRGRFDFSGETVLSNWGQVYRNPSADIRSILDLDGKTVAVMKESVFFVGESGLRHLAERFEISVDFLERDDYRGVFEDVASGRADAGLVNRFFGQRFEKDYRVETSPVLVSPIEIRFGFPKGQGGLLSAAIDKHLGQMKADRTSVYHQALSRWLSQGVGPVWPAWTGPAVAALFGVLALLLFSLYAIRRQVKARTREIASKNRLLRREIEERKRAERALITQFEQISTIFDAMDAVVYVADMATHEMLYLNHYGQSHICGEWEGRKCYEALQVGQDGPCSFCTNDLILEDGEPSSPCVWEFRNTVNERWYRCIDRAIRWPDGRLVRLEIAVDITEVKVAEQAVERENAFLQTIIDGVVDPIMVIALDYKILLMNRAAEELVPGDAGAATGLTCHEASHHSDTPCSGEDHPCPLREVRETGKPTTVVHQHTLGTGESRIFELSVSPLWNEDGSLKGVIEASRDITDRLLFEASLTEKEKRLHHLAHHDALTGLPNRLLFHDRLQHALAKVQRDGTGVAILFLDLDRFKNINDSLGHELGDRVLCEVGKRIRYWVRASDTVARLGGDEFVIVLENVKESTYVAALAQKILHMMAQPIVINELELFVTGTVGISLYPEDGKDAETLMKQADTAMYRGKDKGRNTYQFYTSDINERAHEQLFLEGSLRKALENEQLVLHYQPQYNLSSGELIGLEALLRWHHPKKGLVPPGDFIPLAEETGLIVPIGEWVLRTACEQVKAIQQQGYPPVRVAVNISARQFRQAGFIEMIDRVLEDTGLDPQWLELEITESVIMENFQEAILILTDIKVRGIYLAIDDFGTGYSSLAYLKLFPINRLKIDRTFVRDITTDANDAAIAASIIGLARNMKLEVMAEGVETEEQLAFLRAHACHTGQGFLFSRPLALEDLAGALGRPLEY